MFPSAYSLLSPSSRISCLGGCSVTQFQLKWARLAKALLSDYVNSIELFVCLFVFCRGGLGDAQMRASKVVNSNSCQRCAAGDKPAWEHCPPQGAQQSEGRRSSLRQSRNLWGQTVSYYPNMYVLMWNNMLERLWLLLHLALLSLRMFLIGCCAEYYSQLDFSRSGFMWQHVGEVSTSVGRFY